MNNWKWHPKKTDFPELEGEEIIYHRTMVEEIKATVIGCNYWVGITIVQSDEKDHYLACLNGPYSKVTRDVELDERTWKMVFFSSVRQIKQKHMYPSKLIADLNTIGDRRSGNPFPTQNTCPYSS